MMNNEFIKDITKGVKQTSLNQELPPGSPRRYEPAVGIGKHNEMIHRESKRSDSKNLPFSFRKPPKARGRQTYVCCDSCGYIISATTVTVGMVCPECKKFSSVTEVEE
jgi:hypothetical protein